MWKKWQSINPIDIRTEVGREEVRVNQLPKVRKIIAKEIINAIGNMWYHPQELGIEFVIRENSEEILEDAIKSAMSHLKKNGSYASNARRELAYNISLDEQVMDDLFEIAIKRFVDNKNEVHIDKMEYYYHGNDCFDDDDWD